MEKQKLTPTELLFIDSLNEGTDIWKNLSHKVRWDNIDFILTLSQKDFIYFMKNFINLGMIKNILWEKRNLEEDFLLKIIERFLEINDKNRSTLIDSISVNRSNFSFDFIKKAHSLLNKEVRVYSVYSLFWPFVRNSQLDELALKYAIENEEEKYKIDLYLYISERQKFSLGFYDKNEPLLCNHRIAENRKLSKNIRIKAAKYIYSKNLNSIKNEQKELLDLIAKDY